MVTMAQTGWTTCRCCGGDIPTIDGSNGHPDLPSTVDDDGYCSGSVTPRGRCGAWTDDDIDEWLAEIADDDAAEATAIEHEFVEGIEFLTPPECQGKMVHVSYGFTPDGDAVVQRCTDDDDGDSYRVGVIGDNFDWVETYCAATGAPPVHCDLTIAEYLAGVR